MKILFENISVIMGNASLLLCFLFIISSPVLAAPKGKVSPIKNSSPPKEIVAASGSGLAHSFFKAQNKADFKRCSDEALKLGPKAVGDLVQIMKDGKYSAEARWVSTLLLAKIMGKKSIPFISKFIDHPHYMLRMASLKALLGLQSKDQIEVYKKALRDPSLMVRTQALENIGQLRISELGQDVWQMLLEKQNYQGPEGTMKRGVVIKKVIRTLGDIKHTPSIISLGKLIQRPAYQDIFSDLEYGLEKLTGKKSPEGSREAKIKFWQKSI